MGTLQCDVDHLHTPAVLHKISIAVARDSSYAAASRKQQHGQSDDAPANSWEGRVAVIQCDGGRVQVRDDCWGKDKPEEKSRRWWRETQTGVLQTYLRKPGCEDPTPDVPKCLKDSLWVVPKLNEIHRGHAPTGNSDTEESQSSADQQEDIQETTGITKAEPETIETSSRTARWSGGEPLVKTIVATRRG